MGIELVPDPARRENPLGNRGRIGPAFAELAKALEASSALERLDPLGSLHKGFEEIVGRQCRRWHRAYLSPLRGPFGCIL